MKLSVSETPVALLDISFICCVADTGGTADCFGSHLYTLPHLNVIQSMAFVVMYFAGKEQQSLAIFNFVDLGYHVAGVVYFYHVFFRTRNFLCIRGFEICVHRQKK